MPRIAPRWVCGTRSLTGRTAEVQRQELAQSDTPYVAERGLVTAAPLWGLHTGAPRVWLWRKSLRAPGTSPSRFHKTLPLSNFCVSNSDFLIVCNILTLETSSQSRDWISWSQAPLVFRSWPRALSLYATMNHFSIRLWRVTSGFYMTTSYDLLSGWTEKKFQSTSQSQTCIKKRSRSLIHYSFLNPGKTITSEKYAQQISEMHQKLQHLQPSLVNRKGPILLHDNAQPTRRTTNISKAEQTGLQSFASSTIFTWSLTNPLPLLQASWQLFQGKRFHNQQKAENAFQEIVKSRDVDFYATGINKLTSCLQNCVDCNGSYFV